MTERRNKLDTLNTKGGQIAFYALLVLISLAAMGLFNAELFVGPESFFGGTPTGVRIAGSFFALCLIVFGLWGIRDEIQGGHRMSRLNLYAILIASGFAIPANCVLVLYVMWDSDYVVGTSGQYGWLMELIPVGYRRHVLIAWGIVSIPTLCALFAKTLREIRGLPEKKL